MTSADAVSDGALRGGGSTRKIGPLLIVSSAYVRQYGHSRLYIW